MQQQPLDTLDVTQMVKRVTKKQPPPNWREMQDGLAEIERRVVILLALDRMPRVAREEARVILEIATTLRR